MFGSLKVAGVFIIILAVVLGAFYWYYRDTNKRIELLVQETTALRTAIAMQDETIRVLKDDAERQSKILNDTFKKFDDARKSVSDLEKKIKQFEVGKKAAKDPTGIQSVINKELSDLNRCIELSAGDKPTAAELAATTADKINSRCPELANPNYRGPK